MPTEDRRACRRRANRGVDLASSRPGAPAAEGPAVAYLTSLSSAGWSDCSSALSSADAFAIAALQTAGPWVAAIHHGIGGSRVIYRRGPFRGFLAW